MKRLLTPALALFFLSPTVGELLSSSSPPAEFFQPFTFLLLACLYGSGALIARELAHRWSKGWPSVLLLGAAYGIVEEGLAVKSFFDPNWMDLGALGVYGRWAGVNWVWSVGLTIYHAVFSIGIPILLVGLLFPAQRDRPWLSTNGFRWIVAGFGAVTVFINLALTPYRPSVVAQVLSAASVVGLGIWARSAGSPQPAASPPVLGSPLRIGLAGFAATIGLFFLLWFLPNTPVPPMVTTGLTLAYAAWVWTRFGRRAAHPGWSPSHALAMASGALTFFVLLSPVIEFDPNRLDNTQGATLVGLTTAILLVWGAWRLRRRGWHLPGAVRS
jgi:hypothetical protein